VIFNEAEEQGYGWMKKILSFAEKPDAVFLCNDVNAILAINMFKEAGLKVPDDISIIGFDNIDLGEHFIPSISTVDINKEMMGMKAAQLLLDYINKSKTGVENISFPATLVIRDSVKER